MSIFGAVDTSGKTSPYQRFTFVNSGKVSKSKKKKTNDLIEASFWCLLRGMTLNRAKAWSGVPRSSGSAIALCPYSCNGKEGAELEGPHRHTGPAASALKELRVVVWTAGRAGDHPSSDEGEVEQPVTAQQEMPFVLGTEWRLTDSEA